jgi:hypothetical protein
MALTFAKIARQTHDDFRRKHSCSAARKAYDTVARLIQKVDLSDEDSQAARSGLAQVKIELLTLGETF